MAEGHALIGTSGWSYQHWTGGMVYPADLAGREHLGWYAQHFPTVEINASYYRLPPRTTFATWRRGTPADFVFAVKASRYLTHMKKLKDPEEPLRRLLENAGGLEDKLGPVLFQFPRQWKLNLARLSDFLAALAALAALDAHRGQRYVFEFRHQTWLVDEVFAQLRAHHAGLCLPIGWGIPLEVELTADWTYLRFHGGQHGIAFSDAELRPWAERIRAWLGAGIDVYAYFNNDTIEDGRAPAIDNARRLRALVTT